MINILPVLAVLFASKGNVNSRYPSTLNLFKGKMADRDLTAQTLLDAARKVGQAGSLASEEDRSRIQDLANKLIPKTDSKPAKYPLTGVHKLVYSAAPGGSSGKLFGNVVGKVDQVFEDKSTFYNTVSLGPVKIALKAERNIKSDKIINVSFKETTVSIFGNPVVQKEAGGGGSWKCLFVGEIEDTNGERKLLRIMETPSLFIIEQPL